MSFHSGATELTEGDDQLDCVKKKCDIQNTLNHSLFQLRLFLKLCVPYCVKCPEITDIVCGYNLYMHFIQLPKS